MDLFDTVQELWLNFQQGQMPDLGSWNYGLLALFIVIQGRISAVISGIAAAAGYLNLGPIIVIALLVRILVDVFWYRIGATGHIGRLGGRFNLYNKIAGPVEESMAAKPMQYILLAKLSNSLSMPAVIAAGSANLPLRSWLPGSILGELVWTVPLLLFGYFVTDASSSLNNGLSYALLVISTFFMVLFVLKTVKQRRASKITA